MNVKVVLGRMDNNQVVEVEDYMSIASALGQAGYTKADNEVIQDLEGNDYEGGEEVENGKAYFLVQRVKSGC